MWLTIVEYLRMVEGRAFAYATVNATPAPETKPITSEYRTGFLPDGRRVHSFFVQTKELAVMAWTSNVA